MARIETYGRDTIVTAFDKVIGTDRESGKATKNYEMGAIRDFILEGASPDVGGQLKITSVIQDTPIPNTESPDVLLNNLDPVIEITKYEILIVRLTFNDSNNEDKLTENVYMFNKVDVVVGFEEYESTPSDFILLSSKTETSEVVIDLSTLVSSVGAGNISIYKGFNSSSESHEIKTISQTFLGQQVIYTEGYDSNTIFQKGLFSDDLLVTTEGGTIKFSTENIIQNIGDGVQVYKGYEGSTQNKHQLKTIKSSDNTVEINSLENEVDLKVYNPVTNVGAFKVLDIGGDSVGTTYSVAGDIVSAEVVLLNNSSLLAGQNNIKITLAKPMLNENYYVRVHYQSLDASLPNDPERLAYKPVTREHTINDFVLSVAEEIDVEESGSQSYLVAIEVVQAFFSFNDEPVLAGYQIAEGDCSNFDVDLATWNDVFVSNEFDLEDGDVIYTDSLETTPFVGSVNYVYRLRRNPSVGSPLLLDKQFSINNQGVVSELNSCGGFGILRMSVGNSEFKITGAEPLEQITVQFSQCTSNQSGNPCGGNSFTLPPVNLGLGVNTLSTSFTADIIGETSVNPYLWIDGGQGTGDVTITVTSRSSGLSTGQTIQVNSESNS